jgi:ankyrin repeat protein
MTANGMEVLQAAVDANDAAAVAHVLQAHPGLKTRLDEPLPGATFGTTALLRAVEQRNREMVEALLDAGAGVDARSRWWAGSWGVLDGDSGLEALLIARGATVDAHAAARMGMLDRLAAIVAANPDAVHARGGDGQTPLHFAGTVDTARYLLDHGADIDARDVDHEGTPAQWMVQNRHEVARYLVSRGCHTDLLMAAALGDAGLVQRHLDADPASIWIRVDEAHFPKRNPRSGGHIYHYSLGGNRGAHTVAHQHGHHDVVRLLMERSPTALGLIAACELGDEPLARALAADHPGLIGTLPPGELRRLAAAAEANRTDVLRLMLAIGWPVDAQGPNRQTALHWAGFHGNADAVRELLRFHPPLDVRDAEFGGTPLGWALHGSRHGWHRDTGDHVSTVELLLDAGAPPTASLDGVQASPAVLDLLRRRQA